METLGFWRKASWAALQATVSFYGLAGRSPLLLAVTGIAYVMALLAVRILGGAQQMSEELRWIIAITVAAAIMIGPVYLVNLIIAPVRFAQEQQREADQRQESAERYRTELEAERKRSEDRRERTQNREHFGLYLVSGERLIETASAAKIQNWADGVAAELESRMGHDTAMRFTEPSPADNDIAGLLDVRIERLRMIVYGLAFG